MTATLEPPRGTDERLLDPLGHGVPRRPRLRPTVRRPRLLAELTGKGERPFAVLVAPAGYGKTTLLCEWSARDSRAWAWVTLDRRHDDPRFLLGSIARAVDEAEARTTDERIVLVLDDVHAVTSAAARDALQTLAAQPPAGMTLVFASRAHLPLPVARLRAEGAVTEIHAPELAMNRTEAGALFRAAGLELERDDLDVLVRRTEGWPVALALAALSLAGQAVPSAGVARFGGADPLVSEYLRDEVLASLSGEELRFALHTSVLDVLSAPLCEAVFDVPGSGRLLAGLQRSHFPLVALDRTAEHFRHHRLLREMLHTELRRTEPDVELAVHRRASAWHAAAGDRQRALHHALAAKEIGYAGDLVWADLAGSLEHGSSTAVEHWLSRFTDAQIAAHPRLALAAAGTQLARGQGHLAEHWLLAAAAGDGGEIDGGVIALRAALGRDGLERMSADADRASAVLAPDSPCQALCSLVAGVAEQLRGNLEPARLRLEEGARRAAVPAPQIHALCLSQLALVALDEDDTEGAAHLASRARAQVARFGLDSYPTSALVLAVSALVRAQRGRVDDANQDMREGAALLERMTDLAPWYVIEVEIVLARAALRLSDINEARTWLTEAHRLVARLPEAVTLAAWLRDAEADVAGFTQTTTRLPSSLTTAELRILLYLPTHLSFREIAERTFVSANTVKTQANAVYRKLDVRSRSEAVARARTLGLLDL